MTLIPDVGPHPGPARPVPGNLVVILGAGKSVREPLPPAMVSIGKGGRVLDWLLAAFSVLPDAEVHFVCGYMAQKVMELYDGIVFHLNPDWEHTGPARSLAAATLRSRESTYVSYSDVVFRPTVVEAIARLDADLVLAVDSRWRVRYDARSEDESRDAEKVVCDGDRVKAVGKHIPSSEATAEFVGLMRLSGTIAERLQGVLRSGLFSEAAGLPEIIQFLLEKGFTARAVDVLGEWAELNAPQDLAHFVLGTKAESLERLRPLVQRSRIGEQVAFTQGEWRTDPEGVLARIRGKFADRRVIVRSSALTEDLWQGSRAGAYTSVPDVPCSDLEAVTRAVAAVLASYGEVGDKDQVLVQEMLRDVTLSGVLMTRTPGLGAPYLVFGFDDTTSRTDAVTSGGGAHVRTVFLHRGAPMRPEFPPELARLLGVVEELEGLVGHDSLDIEFAFTRDGQAHVLQVRPIALADPTSAVDDARVAEALADGARFVGELMRPSPFLLGESTQLSVMSDWNPAEIIGVKPGRLAFSLYRHLITDEVWAAHRAELGYRDVRPCHLIVDVIGHPYVDVRATFNAYVPAALPDDLAERLVEHSLAYLRTHPALHDKVEFDVLYTCATVDFDERAERLRDAGFSAADVAALRAGLLEVTHGIIRRCDAWVGRLGTLQDRYDRIAAADVPSLERAFLYLEDTRRIGTLVFAHLARAAFVATALLRSLESAGCTDRATTDAFLASVRTVTSDIQEEAARVAAGACDFADFERRFGHLRPGTYEITSPHYASAPERFLRPMVAEAAGRAPSRAPSPWNDSIRAGVDRLLAAAGLEIGAEVLERFARTAIEGREYSKFVFTRGLSAALEALADFGQAHFLSREEMSHLRLHDLLALRAGRAENCSATLHRLSRQGREAWTLMQNVCLPSQVFSVDDLFCFEQLRAAPNFVTQKKVTAPVVSLTCRSSPEMAIEGRIVVIQNADPGFDWIFSRGLAGLVTQYGGVNSHMAVRAAEFSLPAAIGVGDLLYQDVAKAQVVELDCASRAIRVVRAKRG